MFSRTILLGFLAVTCQSARAAAIVDFEVFCRVGDVISAPSRPECHLQSQVGTASAGLFWDYEYSPVRPVVGLSARAEYSGDAEAQARGSILWLFTTTGPIRPGIVEFEINRSSDYVPPHYSYGRVGEYWGHYGVTSGRFPFSLGEPFSVAVGGRVDSPPGRFLVSARFALYEADGLTAVAPIQVAVPEAASTWLTAAGLSALATFQVTRRRHRRNCLWRI